MADPPAYPTPRWVKVCGVIGLLVVVLVVVLMLTGRGGEHGPGRHGLDGDAGRHTPAASVTENGERQP
jgi:hypothetical protein